MGNVKQLDIGGFKFEADIDNFDDVEFYEMADKVEENPKYCIDILKLAVGESVYKDMAAYFKKKDGKFKMTVVMDAVNKILDITDPKEEASGPSDNSTQTS